MIALLLDEGLPRGAAADLRARGWDVVHVADVGLAGASDADVLQAAAKATRVLVTLDADMSRLLYLSRATQPSVLYFRVEGLDQTAALQKLLAVVPLLEADLVAGAVVAVDATTARVRMLPLV